MRNDSEQVSIDQDRIRQAREIQKERNSSQAVVNLERLRTLPPQVSTYDYNGNALDVHSGTYFQGGVEEDGGLYKLGKLSCRIINHREMNLEQLVDALP